MDIGADLYDLWLDSLLETVRELDPKFEPEIERAWEEVMGVGIRFLVSRYRSAGEEASGVKEYSREEQIR